MHAAHTTQHIQLGTALMGGPSPLLSSPPTRANNSDMVQQQHTHTHTSLSKSSCCLSVKSRASKERPDAHTHTERDRNTHTSLYNTIHEREREKSIQPKPPHHHYSQHHTSLCTIHPSPHRPLSWPRMLPPPQQVPVVGVGVVPAAQGAQHQACCS
mmetsp:Transcript_28030/g.70004  ORF Transcript_28030/g.70004 Transcript_28030/m.70004 type:complete len:156 (-) Transcript_28030:1135-1602(-)